MLNFDGVHAADETMCGENDDIRSDNLGPDVLFIIFFNN